ncbi:hypothetical protein BGW80DRAFT_1328346 [Lactifluus volemus]|nr:hypothetical protein BGW80DRAFT_1328346 [Lactifluus volemus]
MLSMDQSAGWHHCAQAADRGHLRFSQAPLSPGFCPQSSHFWRLTGPDSNETNSNLKGEQVIPIHDGFQVTRSDTPSRRVRVPKSTAQTNVTLRHLGELPANQSPPAENATVLSNPRGQESAAVG